MAIIELASGRFRVHGFVNKPEDAFDWIEKNVQEDQVVRRIAYDTVKGWFVKLVFKREIDAEKFDDAYIVEERSG